MPKRIGILRGGEGKQYEASIKEGSRLISHIAEYLSPKYKPVDILVDKSGVWYLNGLPILPAELSHRVDAVWNVSHPQFSVVLEALSVPVIGGGQYSHALSNNREIFKEHLRGAGLRVPRSIVIPAYFKDIDGDKKAFVKKKATEAFEKFSPPWIVRPLVLKRILSSAMGQEEKQTVLTFPDLQRAIEERCEESIIVEEFIDGRSAFVHSLKGFRGEAIYVFPIIEFFNSDEKEKMEKLVKNLHIYNGAGYYQRAELLLGKREVYVTDLCFSPDLRPNSLFLISSDAVGAKAHHVIEHILENVMM